MKLSSIQAASERIKPHNICVRTPILNSPTVDNIVSTAVGRPIKISFKCEHLQTVGSFKIRGALNFALSLPRNVLMKGLVTHSSGNHGIAVACVGNYLNIPVCVVVPSTVTQGKLKKIKFYGAEVHFCEPTLHDRKAACSRIVTISGMTEVPPFDHEWVIAGQGTQAVEILEALPDIDAIVVAVGGGGMISGVLTAAKGLMPDIKVFGVEPGNADDAHLSLKYGIRRGPTTEGLSTICDALTVFPTGEICWPLILGGCDGIFTVSDSEVVSAMNICLSELKQLVEPSGACALAGVLSSQLTEKLKNDVAISHVAIVLCGGNIELDLFKQMVM